MNVIMFHSVGMQNSDARYAFLSFPVEHFEHFCHYLASRRIVTGFLDVWLHHAQRGTADKNVYLTFDDGFADNWVYAYPIAQKYGIKFTIFVNPEFIQAGDTVRKTMIDKGFDPASRDHVGYLNWPELKALQASGLVDIQSHSMSHTWYPTGPQVIDIAQPDQPYLHPWLIWNQNPTRKANYLIDQTILPTSISPVFEHGRSLGIRRHFFTEEQLDDIHAYLHQQQQQGKDSKTLVSDVNQYILKNRITGRLEDDQELIARYLYELAESKSILEAGLHKSVNILCWPGGAYTNISVALSREVGYQASTLASKGDKHPLAFADYKRIPRFGLSSLWYQDHGKRYYHKHLPVLSFIGKYDGKRSLSGIGLRIVRKLKNSP